MGEWATDKIGELEARVAELEAELEAAQRLAVEHYTARVDADRGAADAQRNGVILAVRWIRAMPRTSLGNTIRVGPEIYQRVASHVARYLERRLDVCDEVTQPTLPPSSDRE